MSLRLAGRFARRELRGGLADAYISDPGQAFSDEALYQPFWLRIRQ